MEPQLQMVTNIIDVASEFAIAYGLQLKLKILEQRINMEEQYI